MHAACFAITVTLVLPSHTFTCAIKINDGHKDTYQFFTHNQQRSNAHYAVQNIQFSSGFFSYDVIACCVGWSLERMWTKRNGYCPRAR